MDIYILYICTIINTTNMYSQILQNYTRGGKQIGLILVKKKKKAANIKVYFSQKWAAESSIG